MKDPKTTITGIATIVAAVTGGIASILSGHTVDWNLIITAALAGFGLLHAADSKKDEK